MPPLPLQQRRFAPRRVHWADAKFAACDDGSAANRPAIPLPGPPLDRASGFTYYRARYHSAALGRFPQTDPVGYSDDMNLYAYVGNDSTNHADPDDRLAMEGFFIGIYAVEREEREGVPAKETIAQYHSEEAAIAAALVAGALLCVGGGCQAAAVAGGSLPSRATVSRAILRAASGGKHAGLLYNYVSRSTKQIERAIKPFTGRIKEHPNKIRHPERYVDDWQKMNEKERRG